MTTRRRRAGSENYYLEDEVSQDTSVPQPDPSNLPNQTWAPLKNNQSLAYYKKTDSPQASNNILFAGATAPQIPNWGNIPQSQNYPQYQASNSHQYQSSNYGLNTPTTSAGYGFTEDLSLNTTQTDQGDMASRDRTLEFTRIIRSQQGSHVNGMISQRHGKKPQDVRQYTEFMQRSKLIARNISSTYAKLEKLTLLAKKRSLFDDGQDREVQELTGIIRHDLTSLTKQLEDLRSKSRAQSSVTGGSGHLQKHSANLVGTLQNKVKGITEQFREVLEVRTENLKKQAERRDQFTGGAISGELPSAAVTGHHHGSVLIADEVASSETDRLLGATGGGAVAINMGGMYQNQLHLMEEQDTYLQSRADTMKTIESTIVELGQMFTQLANMVKEQEELVTRIDSNVDDAVLNVEAGHSELLKYFKNISSNRWLMIKVFGILIVFFIVFVVFMA